MHNSILYAIIFFLCFKPRCPTLLLLWLYIQFLSLLSYIITTSSFFCYFLYFTYTHIHTIIQFNYHYTMSPFFFLDMLAFAKFLFTAYNKMSLMLNIQAKYISDIYNLSVQIIKINSVRKLWRNYQSMRTLYYKVWL